MPEKASPVTAASSALSFKEVGESQVDKVLERRNPGEYLI